EEYISEGTPQDVITRYASLPEIAANTYFGAYDDDIVILDTETTGFSITNDELIQIAAARMKNGEITEWYITFVNPSKSIPDDIVHLTNIHNSDVKGAPFPAEAVKKLVEFVGDSKIVAHNAEFDRNFVTKHPAGYPLLENTWIDSLDLSRIALPRMKSHRLLDLTRAFGVISSTHRADEDVAATCAMFRILLAGVVSMPPALIQEIATLDSEENWPTVEVFKYFAQRVKPEKFSLGKTRLARIGGNMPEHSNPEDERFEDFTFLEYIDDDELISQFSGDGTLGRIYDDYEARDEQVEMALNVSNAFRKATNLVVEAGTGVGKSMAYLIPAALFALKNNLTVGIATKTNALLDQLVYKEIPLLASELSTEDKPLTYASLKGYSHYPCLKKVDDLLRGGPVERHVGQELHSQAPALAALLSFIEQTDYDDADALKIDHRLLPRPFYTTTSRECLKRKCPYYPDLCYVLGARDKAKDVSLVVTNHSLLFCDILSDGSLLPPIKYWVIDEAHGTENEARQAFSYDVESDGLYRLASRISGDDSQKNIFLKAQKAADMALDMERRIIFSGLAADAKRAGVQVADSIEALGKSLKRLLKFDKNGQNKAYDTTEIWINDKIESTEEFEQFKTDGTVLYDRLGALMQTLPEMIALLEGVKEARGAQLELATLSYELDELHESLHVLFKEPSKEFVYAAILNRKNERGGDRYEALLYNVGEKLNETLYPETSSIIFTSATLSIGKTFESFKNSVGLGQTEMSGMEAISIPSSFDFDHNMTIYVITDIPDPDTPNYLEELQRLLTGVHLAQNGSILTLFTNRRQMEKCFDKVNPELKNNGLRLVYQKYGTSVKGLRDDFLKDEHLSLFALKSFWA
ncbi:MAG: DNA polymerase III subunit epsilon, partial [Eggerthellaceae bacterium]|nr:DNA polymerase III subunit epsilon [Eggerthellaceae bacterium]